MPPHQDAALSALFTRIREAPSPFYQRRLGAAAASGVPHALDGVPLTRRDDIRNDQLQHLPHGTRPFQNAGHPVRAGISGSGANLLVLTWTAADLARERVAGTRLLERLGVTRGMRVANTLPGAMATPGSLLLGDTVEELGALDIPLGVVDGEAAARSAWELIDRVQPEILILNGTSATHLLASAPPARREWWRGIIWLRNAGDGTVPAPPTPSGFVGWQRQWLAVAEATSFVAWSCPAARFHALDHVVVEVADDATGVRCAAGQVGTLVVTTLAGDTPLLRYASGIRVRMVASTCPCGESAGFGLL